MLARVLVLRRWGPVGGSRVGGPLRRARVRLSRVGGLPARHAPPAAGGAALHGPLHVLLRVHWTHACTAPSERYQRVCHGEGRKLGADIMKNLVLSGEVSIPFIQYAY